MTPSPQVCSGNKIIPNQVRVSSNWHIYDSTTGCLQEKSSNRRWERADWEKAVCNEAAYFYSTCLLQSLLLRQRPIPKYWHWSSRPISVGHYIQYKYYIIKSKDTAIFIPKKKNKTIFKKPTHLHLSLKPAIKLSFACPSTQFLLGT